MPFKVIVTKDYDAMSKVAGEIMAADIKKKQVVAVRRDTGEKKFVKAGNLKKAAQELLEDVQESMLRKARKFLKENTVEAKDFESFQKAIKDRKMVRAFWCGDTRCEEDIKSKTAATIRLIPFKKETMRGKCIHCSNKAKHAVYFARAY